MTEARFLKLETERSQARIHELTSSRDSPLPRCCGVVGRHPRWFLLAGFVAAYGVSRILVPRLPGAPRIRAALGFVGGTFARAARAGLVNAILSAGR